MSASAPQLQKSKKLKSLSQSETQKRTGTRKKDGGWDTDPHATVPEYNSEHDPHCPRAVVSQSSPPPLTA
jgi:hypothetical protein